MSLSCLGPCCPVWLETMSGCYPTRPGFCPIFSAGPPTEEPGEKFKKMWKEKAESGSAKTAYKHEKHGDSGKEMKSIFKYRWCRQTGEMPDSKFQNYTKYWGRRVIQFGNNIWGLKRVQGPPSLVCRGMKYANLSLKAKKTHFDEITMLFWLQHRKTRVSLCPPEFSE